jgi:hypothetical protein
MVLGSRENYEGLLERRPLTASGEQVDDEGSRAILLNRPKGVRNRNEGSREEKPTQVTKPPEVTEKRK